MTIAREEENINYTSGSVLTLASDPFGAALSTDDLILAHVVLGNIPAPAPPAGYTLFDPDATGAYTWRIGPQSYHPHGFLYYKRAAGGETDSGTFTKQGYYPGWITTLVYSGVDWASVPFDPSEAGSDVDAGEGLTSISNASLTLTYEQSALIQFGFVGADDDMAFGGTMTEIVEELNGGYRCAAAEELAMSSGPTGGRSIIGSGYHYRAAVMLALRNYAPVVEFVGRSTHVDGQNNIVVVESGRSAA